MSARRRKNTIGGNFSARLVETMKSPAFQVLSLAEHRILLRAEIELREHGGHDNGALRSHTPTSGNTACTRMRSRRLYVPLMRSAC